MTAQPPTAPPPSTPPTPPSSPNPVPYTPVPPPRAKTSSPRGCLPTLVVLLVLLAIPVAGYIASDALANQPPKPIDLGHGVSLTVPWEWEFGGRSDDGNTILLSQGNASVAVSVVDGGDVNSVVANQRNEWTSTGSVSASDITTVTDIRPAGQPTLRFAYSGVFPDIASSVEGEYTGVQGTGLVVTFDGWAGEGDYILVRDEINQMIRTATIP